MPKVAPTVNSPVQQDPQSTEARARQFRENEHRGHPMTRVGSFTDPREPTTPHDVWYCQRDHVVLIV